MTNITKPLLDSLRKSDKNSRILTHAMLTIFQQQNLGECDKHNIMPGYHKLGVQLIKACQAHDLAAVQETLRKADDTLADWLKAIYAKKFNESYAEIHDIEADFASIASTYIMVNQSESTHDDVVDKLMKEITIDEDEMVRSAVLEESMSALQENLRQMDYTDDNTDGDDEHEGADEDDDDVYDDDDDYDDDDYDYTIADCIADWPMPRQVLLHAVCDALVRNLHERDIKMVAARQYHDLAQRAIMTYIKPATQRQRNIALDKATEALDDLLDEIFPTDDIKFGIDIVDETDIHDFRMKQVVYDAVYTSMDEIESMDDDEVKEYLRSVKYDKDYKEYFGEAVEHLYEQVFNSAQELQESMLNGDEEEEYDDEEESSNEGEDISHDNNGKEG